MVIMDNFIENETKQNREENSELVIKDLLRESSEMLNRQLLGLILAELASKVNRNKNLLIQIKVSG